MLYDGEPVGFGDVRLVTPRESEVAAAETGENDDFGPWSRWFDFAKTHEAIVYFSVECGNSIVGEVFLHDIDRSRREALVGYRIFEAIRRGQGVGKEALRLLTAWAATNAGIGVLFAIARSTNQPSRRLAESAGFSYTGPAREDSSRVVYRKELSL